MKKLLVLGLLFVTATLFSQKQNEKYYQEAFADIMEGRTEVLLPDRTRVDIETDTHVIEVDFGPKWAEAIGQSLHYEGMVEGKKAGILLVIEGYEEERYVKRVMGVAAKHGIDVWIWDYSSDEWSRVEYRISYKF